MKKGVQIAFAIALATLAIISMFCSTGHMATIIYAVALPSFILSIVSFFADIAEKCDSEGEKLHEASNKSSELSKELATQKIKTNVLCNDGVYDEKVVITPAVEKHLEDASRYMVEALGYNRARIFFLRCKIWCDRLMVGGYAVLFLSLALSPYVTQWLSVIDLNCITLWSLLLLYVTLEFKSTICSKVFLGLSKRYIKKVNEQK